MSESKTDGLFIDSSLAMAARHLAYAFDELSSTLSAATESMKNYRDQIAPHYIYRAYADRYNAAHKSRKVKARHLNRYQRMMARTQYMAGVL